MLMSKKPTNEEVKQAILDLHEGFHSLNELLDSRRQRIVELESRIIELKEYIQKIDMIHRNEEALRNKEISDMLDVFAKIEMALYDEGSAYAFIERPGLDALRSITAKEK
jgi:uncharacterized protein (DUF2344 family)